MQASSAHSALAQLRDEARGARRLAIDILAAALAAVEAGQAVRRGLGLRSDALLIGGEAVPLAPGSRVYVVGAGKAGVAMARAAYDSLGERIAAGCVAVPDGAPPTIGPIALKRAGHPLPDRAGLTAARRVAELAEGAGDGDIVLCLFSGGGSAMLSLPAPGVGLDDKQRVTRLLLRSGATIHELNAVRKHLSRLKGGQLARLAAPAHVVGLYLSDVPGDRLESIASGPTAPDPSTYGDAWRALMAHGLLEAAPPSVVARLREGRAGRLPETPKGAEPFWSGVRNLIVASGQTALAAARERATALGLHVHVQTGLTGEAAEAGAWLGALVRQIAHEGGPVARPACVLAAGETTVVVRGAGKGGRNQELALAAALEMDGLEGVALAAFATDGVDGPTDVAGALADGTTLGRAQALQLDPRACLSANDSYSFFHALGDHIRTGPTGTNVADLAVALVR
ncbi:MAG: glycerate kinase [Chloroflexi bacterium]|nr:glycerate kinase [Chloroflexota bacterium]